MIRLVLSLVAAIAIAATASAAPTEDQIAFGHFGKLTIYRNSPEPKNMVLFVSGDGGWDATMAGMAKTLAARDATVVGIDVAHFLSAIENGKDSCAYPAADFEQLSQFVQKKLGFHAYHRPILAGYSTGSTLVYALLGQGPRGTFIGGISMGFCSDIATRRPWCKGFGLQYTKHPDGKGIDISVMKSLTEPWMVLQGDSDKACSPVAAAAFVAQVPNGHFVSLRKIGHSFAPQSSWAPQFLDAYDQIVASAKRPTPLPPIGERATPSIAPDRNADVSELPLIEVPATAPPSDTLAILLTGDGGWAGLDREVSARLAAKGIPVVGLDTLAYFWNKRSPDETAHAVDAMLNHYLAAWNKQRAILVGYSFGADVLPFVVHRLDADMQHRVRVMTLIVPSLSAQFEFHVAEWAGIAFDDTVPTFPEMQKASGINTLCIYGSDERDSLCPRLGALGAKVLVLPGGHHVGGDYDRLVTEILAAAK